MEILAVVFVVILAMLIGILITSQERRYLAARQRSEKRPANGTGSVDRLGGPRTIAALSCGAKVVQLEPHDVNAFATPYFDDQPESVREGGAFFQCYPRCPYILDCPRQKALAGFHLGEDVRVPLENGLYLELQRGDGHRRVAVVGDPDVEFEPVALAGVTFLAGGKRYTTVPPLMQQVEQLHEDFK